MRLELPLCKRCCFCLPLRHGLIVWAYFKLFIASLCLYVVGYDWRMVFEGKYEGGVQSIIIESIATFFVLSDITLCIIFIVGCHKKNVKLIRIFYFYSQIFIVLPTFLGVYHLVWSISRTLQAGGDIIWSFRLIDCGVLFAEIAVQIYILLLIRSEMMKINEGCQFRFENTTADAKCTLSMERGGKNGEVFERYE